MIDITPALRVIAPHVDDAAWTRILTPVMASAGMTTPRRAAMFLGQCVVESAGFMRLEEDLYYTHVTALRAAWPARFPLGMDPTPYLCNPEALAGHVYDGRHDLGNIHPGDGWLFRGRGLIQITGRLAYTDFAHALGREPEEIPDWVSRPEGAARSACWYWGWASHGALMHAADNWSVADATRTINPAQMDQAARGEACDAALSALLVKADQPATMKSADDLNSAELAHLNPAPGGSPASLEHPND